MKAVGLGIAGIKSRAGFLTEFSTGGPESDRLTRYNLKLKTTKKKHNDYNVVEFRVLAIRPRAQAAGKCKRTA
jgi:hypothetical protein